MTENKLVERLSSSEILVSDGATGTNLQTMGLRVGAPAELWVLENPEAIRTLNQAFVDAGADILLTCTFGGTRLRLNSSNLADKFESINRKAVEITKTVAWGKNLLVAGSIGPLGHLLAPLGTVTMDQAQAEFADQTRLLCEGGVDLIVVETQFDINEARAAILGVRAIDAHIPLVCSFSFDRGTHTMMGVSPAAMAVEIGPMDVDLLGINCGRTIEENLQALQQLRQSTDKPIWFKPNAGMPTSDETGQPVYSISPQDMGALVPFWIEAGARIIGGCCGTSPAHLAEISLAVHRHV